MSVKSTLVFYSRRGIVKDPSDKRMSRKHSFVKTNETSLQQNIYLSKIVKNPRQSSVCWGQLRIYFVQKRRKNLFNKIYLTKICLSRTFSKDVIEIRLEKDNGKVRLSRTLKEDYPTKGSLISLVDLPSNFRRNRICSGLWHEIAKEFCFARVWVWVTCAEESQSSRRNARSRGKERPCHTENIFREWILTRRRSAGGSSSSSSIARSWTNVFFSFFPAAFPLVAVSSPKKEDPRRVRTHDFSPITCIHRIHRKT